MHLIEFKNSRHITLRGVFIESTNSISKTVLVCIPGFEGVSSTAPKFVRLSEKLLSLSPVPIAGVFRYDPTGLGLSDGEFFQITIDTLVDDFTHAMNYLLNKYTKFIFIAHSLGNCILTQYLNSNEKNFEIVKIILLAPAFNQSELHRYWYMQELDENITWKKFQENFKEFDFQEYLNNKPIGSCKIQRAHKILYEFVRLCSKTNFSFKLNQYQNEILHIHGDQDPVVPIESVEDQFQHTLVLHTNDHDLEQPDILNQWTNKAVEFICNK